MREVRHPPGIRQLAITAVRVRYARNGNSGILPHEWHAHHWIGAVAGA